MEDILKQVAGAVLSALVVILLGLNKKRVVHSEIKPTHWVWRGMKLIGKWMFLYGLFVFASNMLVNNGIANENASTGATILGIGFILWVIGGIFVFIKKGY